MSILQPCNDCGETVSRNAVQCPHCGSAWPRAGEKTATHIGLFAWLSLAFLPLLIVLGYCAYVF